MRTGKTRQTRITDFIVERPLNLSPIFQTDDERREERRREEIVLSVESVNPYLKLMRELSHGRQKTIRDFKVEYENIREIDRYIRTCPDYFCLPYLFRCLE